MGLGSASLALTLSLIAYVYLNSAQYGLNLMDITEIITDSVDPSRTQAVLDKYNALHDDNATGAEQRKGEYMTLVNNYYDLATGFYEWGWGQSFHFATRHRLESFRESIIRHEHWLALQLGLEPGMKVLDIGCGVGGPLRNIAIFSGAHITGINNNAYQIRRGILLNEKANLTDSCNFIQTDFHKMAVADNSYDRAYTIEASCHAPDRVALFKEILRTLKPGGRFGGYEWCLTDEYDATNPHHVKLKKDIEIGNGLPDIVHTAVIIDSLKEAGFNVISELDLAHPSLQNDEDIPWWSGLTGFQFTEVGKFLGHWGLKMLEFVRVMPEGASGTSDMLNIGADGLREGGMTHTFTPMYFFLAEKPL